MGLDVCPALWGSFQNSPQPIRTPQPQSQASPLAWPSRASGLSPWGLLPLSVSRNRINVCMNFRFQSVWCFGGQTGPRHTPMWPLSQWPGSRKMEMIPLPKPTLTLWARATQLWQLCETAPSSGKAVYQPSPEGTLLLSLVQAGGVPVMTPVTLIRSRVEIGSPCRPVS